MENQLTALRGSGGEARCTFDARLEKFVPRSVSPFGFHEAKSLSQNQMDLWEESSLHLMKTTAGFMNALKALKVSQLQDFSINSFRISERDHWEEIMKTMEIAARDYESVGKKLGKVREAFGKLSDSSTSIQNFVGLLPHDNCKTLCGDLTLNLTAMMGHKGIRGKMASLLGEIPDIVDGCEKCITEIHVHIFIAHEDVVRWYGHSSAKRVHNTLLPHDFYDQSDGLNISKIGSGKCKLVKEASLHFAARAKLNLAMMLDTNACVQTITQKAETLTRNADMTVEILVDQGKNARWNNEVAEERQSRIKMTQEDEEYMEIEDNGTRRLAHLRRRTSKTPKALIESLELDVTQSEHIEDLRMVLTVGLDESLGFQGRSRYICKADEFRDWMSSGRSAALFIQGHGDFEKMTPASYFITLLRESIQKIPNTLTLTFFCGLHTNDETSGPSIMAKTIFGQALAVNASDDNKDANGNPLLSFLGVQDVQNMQADDYDTYLSGLAQLLRNIRRRYSAIFILIDSVDFYDDEYEEEILQFISKIKRLIKVFNKRQKQENGGVLKLLMTASSQSSCFSPSSRSSLIMHMPEEIDGDEDKFEEFVRSSDED
ncbi:hypothetical protein HBI81_195060 [Parastagonospora nodorum]|nr:hypothetical protein HBI09_202430 [Parastagonospora nodorum]KAH4050020.1 hypothetical protein HBH49_140990 [Parastagonospora nodorum]KAH4981595.1 hypothetical protein HBI77_220170 [Parastagonospora nodorum]KAH5068588.1 hypothetical protein HBH95_190530 [Parastagonospora nodorum]KAH5177426.1 hypothetical protein HBH76_201650 [Parastagonospora nodorum]